MRAGWLVLVVAMLSPVNPLLLVGLPFALLILAFRPPDLVSLAAAVGILGLAFAGRPVDGDPVWMAERGWCLLAGGAFVGTTALLGRGGLLVRSTLAVATAGAGVAVAALAAPARIAELDWWMAADIRHSALQAYSGLSALGADPAWLDSVGAAMYDWMGFQQAVYPAFLALATLAALAVASYGASRSRGSDVDLAELRDFRFSDHLVWLLVAGLVLLLFPSGGLGFRLGENATLFMGALYLLRGIGVLIYVGAALVTSLWSAALWALLALLFYPIVVGTALVLGLSDTWLDLRARLRHARLERH